MRITGAAIVWVAAGLAGLPAQAAEPDPAAVRQLFALFFKPVPKRATQARPADAAAELGRHLYFERQLSPDRNRSCNDCHDLARHGTNGEAARKARADGTLERDVPSLYHLAELNLLGWDGAHTTLRDHVAAALTRETESAMPDRAAVVARLNSLEAYPDRFKAAFANDPQGITFDRVTLALTGYIKGLVTHAPFDAFMDGDDQALTARQLRGAVLFDRHNCSACHTGSTIGGQMLHKAGIAVAWPNADDLGHYHVSGKQAHKMIFRVPSLRNVAQTAPYFHDHSAKSLRRAIRDIAIREQGLELPLDEIFLIEDFMRSFTGALPEQYIRPPQPRR